MSGYTKLKPDSIQHMFNNIANRYDITNKVISFNMYNGWNRRLASQTLQPFKDSFALLDLCAGTGEVTFECLKKNSAACQAYLLDFSSEMLQIAKSKAAKLPLNHHQMEYLEADAQKVPLPDQSIDCATIAYGIRNVQDPAKCFEEVFRVLKPGGCFGILELTRPNHRLLKLGHQLYMSVVMPLLGKLLTSDKQAYQYLCQSIHTFISPQELEGLLKQKGFIKTERTPLAGGIATIIMAHKEA